MAGPYNPNNDSYQQSVPNLRLQPAQPLARESHPTHHGSMILAEPGEPQFLGPPNATPPTPFSRLVNPEFPVSGLASVQQQLDQVSSYVRHGDSTNSYFSAYHSQLANIPQPHPPAISHASAFTADNPGTSQPNSSPYHQSMLQSPSHSVSFLEQTSPSMDGFHSGSTLLGKGMAVSTLAHVSFPDYIKFRSYLETKISPSCRKDEPTITYINRGQTYMMSHSHEPSQNIIYKTQLIIAFHDDHHRQEAAKLWRVWAEKQPNPMNPKAVEIDASSSYNITIIDDSQFDRVTFNWSGTDVARLSIRFNFLSTDFTNLKGIKGIPLRLVALNVHSGGSDSNAECYYTLLKSFRDKGAERKYKDESRHYSKHLGKGKSMIEADNLNANLYFPASPLTALKQPLLASQIPAPYGNLLVSTPDSNHLTNVVAASGSSVSGTGSLEVLASQHIWNSGSRSPNIEYLIRKRKRTTPLRPCNCQIADRDPTYAPNPMHKYQLCMLVQFPRETWYRAVYLERLTMEHFQTQLMAKLDLASPNVSIEGIRRHTLADQVVHMDDEMLQKMDDEIDMVLSIQPGSRSSWFFLCLFF
ncbi:CP2 transcription factor-domain-containing protein [Dimargaris cristalligena]|uniref:CP2 transcription factor-domain-containing protein n=1 Tax=Dimargaris cristalligena TaxID=215637 RepID=A0A4Q0A003_9FUNG|nr:CP2 transcription factor-domain-containing protein [Dimargaris cristalligena]|eukprot:RKP39333.1 CP2 transcription factor-domain-containing protein [Dimargaris cristalligena]